MRQLKSTGLESLKTSKMENYKNASVVMAGIACLITSCQIPVHYALSGLSIAEYNAAWPWIRPFMSMSTPILFAWIGILLRKKYSSPGIWVKTLLLLLIPASYLFWTVLHSRGIILFANGERCMWFYCAIIGYLIPVESLEKHSSEDGWMDLALFLASAFLYWGVCRVVNHFSVASFQMLDSPWIRLFHRAMRFVPLAMAVFFLAGFSFSRAGQSMGSIKATQVVVKCLAVLSLLITLLWCLRWRPFGARMYILDRLFSQPVVVYLIYLVYRKVKIKKKS